MSLPFFLRCAALGALALGGPVRAQAPATPAPDAAPPAASAGTSTTTLVVVPPAPAPAPRGTVIDAFEVAKAAVKPELQTKVVSVYGVGAPAAIDKWYIIFYDPSVPSHGRAVLVENGKLIKAYPANGGATYHESLTFDPAHITSEGPALSAARGYAARHKIRYDTVHALLKQTAANRPFRWRVELLREGRSRGFVYINALDDSVAEYVRPSAKKSSTSDNLDSFGNDVKNTFLDIGGDLEEFFTGTRTVDK